MPDSISDKNIIVYNPAPFQSESLLMLLINMEDFNGGRLSHASRENDFLSQFLREGQESGVISVR